MGRQHWWPAGSQFEVVVGAYLTQNTAWTNVEQAMRNLRGAGALSIPGIRNTTLEELEQLVRPAGYFRQKAARLKRFVNHLDTSYGGSLEAMFERPTEALREELLGLPGIGPETADSILLYAASREVFVVDTYTRRIFERHELAKAATGYEELRLEVQKALTEGLQDQDQGQDQNQDQDQDQSQDQRRGHEQGQEPHLGAANPEAQRKDGAPGGDSYLPDTDSPGADSYLPSTNLSGAGSYLTNAGSPGADSGVTDSCSHRANFYLPETFMQTIHAPSAASQMKRSELSQRYNEFHALIVQTAKHYCGKTNPKCESCPLLPLLPRPLSHSR